MFCKVYARGKVQLNSAALNVEEVRNELAFWFTDTDIDISYSLGTPFTIVGFFLYWFCFSALVHY
jgi:hypothetical protein